MKKAAEWDERYVLGLPVGEHDWVEFKGARALDIGVQGVDENKVLDSLSKQLSAFANSGGGTIIFGVSDARAVDLGGVSLTLKRGTKEWLEDVIPRLVEFELRAFNVYVIEANGPTSAIASGKGLVVVDIPDSENAPHQARDKKYYARVAGKSRPIGHRMVVDILGRRRHPVMQPTFTIARHGSQGVPDLLVRCENKGRVFANYVNGEVAIVSDDDRTLAEDQRYSVRRFDNKERDVVGVDSIRTHRRPFQIARYEPVLPELGFERNLGPLLPGHVESTLERSNRLAWRIHADNAPVERGEVQIRDLRWVG